MKTPQTAPVAGDEDTRPASDQPDARATSSQINALGGMTPEQVRLEALKLATQIVCKGSWPSAGQRGDVAIAMAKDFVGFITPPPSSEAAADAVAVERRA